MYRIYLNPFENPQDLEKVSQIMYDIYNKFIQLNIIDMEPVKDGIASWSKDEWKDFTTMVFESEGAIGNMGKWNPNRGMYAVWKKEHYPSAKILELKGNLKKSFTGKWNLTFETDKAILSAQIPSYGIYHQRGIPPPNWTNKVPFLQRKFFFIIPNLVQDLARKIKRRLGTYIKRKVYEAIR